MATIVIDANIGLAFVLHLDYSSSAQEHLLNWRARGDQIVVPELWWYEIVSGLRKAVAIKQVQVASAAASLDDLAALEFKTIPSANFYHRHALVWAERLRQTVAYDAQYLALAEHLNAEFWTADKKLAERARAAQATFVHFLKPKFDEKQNPSHGGSA